ncbi:hypothetical protein L6R52_41355, partial [Myxococcota bacterium]|nr:hypothetical protein [Myxococcota bacterium]
MSDAPRDVGSTAGRRLVRTGSPRGREVVLTVPRRLVAPGIAAALLVVGAVFTAGFVVGRDSADEAPAP